MKRRVAFMFWLLFLLPFGCVAPRIPAASSTNPDKGIDLLVALEPSAFKELLALKVGILAEQRGLETRVVDVRDLPRELFDGYRAAVIINSIWAGRHRSNVRKFLASLDEKERERVILINTARNEAWKTGERGVHAITCASEANRLDEILAFINQKLDLILAREKN